MSLADNVAQQLIEAIANCTPENIKKIAQAKVEALKLTEPEQKKRDECVAIINSVAPKLKELEEAKAIHANALAKIADANTALAARETAVAKRESDHTNAVAEHIKNVRANEQLGKDLEAYKIRLDNTAKAHETKAQQLQQWEDTLREDAGNIEQAQKLIKRK